MLLEVLGWMGTSMFVVAYFLISYGRLKVESYAYQILNLSGALAVGVSVFPKNAWPAFFLEVIWGSIALASIIRLRMRSVVRPH